MYYTISIEKKSFDFVNSDEPVVINRIRIYHDNGRFIREVSAIADTELFFETDKPEDIAKTLEIWRKGMLYLPGGEKVKDMINFLREHSKELRKGKLYWDIKRIEAKIKELDEEKERLRKQYEEILADGGEGNEQKVREDGFE
ncbi:MAG: hypothetical protein N2V72_00375 [Methanophagales archaeon]|nr:hypothetical protein [Methanophagales archaeon]